MVKALHFADLFIFCDWSKAIPGKLQGFNFNGLQIARGTGNFRVDCIVGFHYISLLTFRRLEIGVTVMSSVSGPSSSLKN